MVSLYFTPLMARMSFVGWSCPGSILYCCKDGAAWIGSVGANVVTVAVRIVSICGGPKAHTYLCSLLVWGMAPFPGLEELPETQEAKLCLPSQAEAVVFVGSPPARLHVFSSNIDLVLSASWVLLPRKPMNFIFFAKESPLSEKKKSPAHPWQMHLAVCRLSVRELRGWF